MLVAGLIEGGSHPWDSPLVIGLLACGLVAVAAFVGVEHRAAEPIMPLHVFRHRLFRAATVGGFAFQFGAYGLQFPLALHVQRSWGMSPLIGGIVLVPYAIGMVAISALLNPRLLERGPRWMLIAGSAIAADGTLVMLSLSSKGTWPLLVVGDLFVGAGTGIYSTALNQLTGTTLGPEQGGIAWRSLSAPPLSC